MTNTDIASALFLIIAALSTVTLYLIVTQWPRDIDGKRKDKVEEGDT